MAKRKRTNNDLQNTIQKTANRATRTASFNFIFLRTEVGWITRRSALYLQHVYTTTSKLKMFRFKYRILGNFGFFLSGGMSLILVCVILTLFQIDMFDLGILRNRLCSHFVVNPFIEEKKSDFCCTTKTSIKKEFTFTYLYAIKHKMWKLLKNNEF